METDTYSALREFADSWWLVVMFAFFVGVVLFTLRPGSRKTHRDIADIPLRDDDPSRLRDDAPKRSGEDEAPRREDTETPRSDGNEAERGGENAPSQRRDPSPKKEA